jgi:pilus assembly protein Flp/PilA
MTRQLLRLLKSEEGATAVEYAVILALLLLGCITAITTVGTTVRDNVFDSSAKLNKAMSTGS